jgi:hypothetical protein
VIKQVKAKLSERQPLNGSASLSPGLDHLSLTELFEDCRDSCFDEGLEETTNPFLLTSRIQEVSNGEYCSPLDFITGSISMSRVLYKFNESAHSSSYDADLNEIKRKFLFGFDQIVT